MFALLNSYGDTIAVFASQKFIIMGMCDDVEREGNWSEVGMRIAKGFPLAKHNG